MNSQKIGRLRHSRRAHALARIRECLADAITVGRPDQIRITLRARTFIDPPPPAANAKDFRASRSPSTVLPSPPSPTSPHPAHRTHPNAKRSPFPSTPPKPPPKKYLAAVQRGPIRPSVSQGGRTKAGCEGRLRAAAKAEIPCTFVAGGGSSAGPLRGG
jgi:hypothetical protein